MSSKPRNFARIMPGEQASLPITMDLELKGKAAVITGGSVVIGSAVAEGLAAEGVNLVLAARQATGRVNTYTGLTKLPRTQRHPPENSSW